MDGSACGMQVQWATDTYENYRECAENVTFFFDRYCFYIGFSAIPSESVVFSEVGKKTEKNKQSCDKTAEKAVFLRCPFGFVYRRYIPHCALMMTRQGCASSDVKRTASSGREVPSFAVFLLLFSGYSVAGRLPTAGFSGKAGAGRDIALFSAFYAFFFFAASAAEMILRMTRVGESQKSRQKTRRMCHPRLSRKAG